MIKLISVGGRFLKTNLHFKFYDRDIFFDKQKVCYCYSNTSGNKIPSEPKHSKDCIFMIALKKMELSSTNPNLENLYC